VHSNGSVAAETDQQVGAQELLEKLEAMRMELFVLSLQRPRPDETVALHLQDT
jgi:hypothetical protein